jgi:chorismate mutase/prephenate dehydratase
MDLNELRQEIDEVDKQIAGLFEKRMEISKSVAAYKAQSGMQILDREREIQKRKAIQSLVGEENREGIGELYGQIMALSRKLQYEMLPGREMAMGFREVKSLHKHRMVVYQGAPGAYSQEAMFTYFGKNVDNFAVDSFREVMAAVESGTAEYGILPIENSTAGNVDEIYDLLVEYDNSIVAEQVIHVEQCLLAVHGAKIKDIKTVYSHPQSLRQSSKFLLPYHWQQVSMQNNAFAARKIAQDQDITQAAIAGEHAAKIYGLQVMRLGINQEGSNSTRFIIVTKDNIFSRYAKKISICFEIPHEKGSLYRMLSHFIYNQLNLTKIESRPVEGKNWEYRFFVDFEGNLKEQAVENALLGLKEEAVNLKVLGNY